MQLADRALARVRGAGRTRFYALIARSFWRMAFPYTEAERGHWSRSVQEAYALHVRVLQRPGMRRVLDRMEREDLATLPLMVASTPFDVARAILKRHYGIRTIPVRPRDDFPYPAYYLNDFHHQSNGNLSMRAALTYEWQLRFLFLGANRLMRQGVVDQIPRGEGLDILDVGCGTAAWVTQAALQDRKHRVTGIDLSPDYLRVARLFRRQATFLHMNAEQMPGWWSSRFDLLTCIWLFHELPLAAIERITEQMARVLKPGGRLVFMDAAQTDDLPYDDPEKASHNFREFLNEPYYMRYRDLDLTALFARHGLAVETSERWYLSKLLVARKA